VVEEEVVVLVGEGVVKVEGRTRVVEGVRTGWVIWSGLAFRVSFH